MLDSLFFKRKTCLMIFSIHLEKLKQKYNKKKGLTAAMLSVPRS